MSQSKHNFCTHLPFSCPYYCTFYSRTFESTPTTPIASGWTLGTCFDTKCSYHDNANEADLPFTRPTGILPTPSFLWSYLLMISAMTTIDQKEPVLAALECEHFHQVSRLLFIRLPLKASLSPLTMMGFVLGSRQQPWCIRCLVILVDWVVYTVKKSDIFCCSCCVHSHFSHTYFARSFFRSSLCNPNPSQCIENTVVEWFF